jgi:hypothetical protein
VLAAGVESFSCPTGQQSCGSSGCYDPNIQGCANDVAIIQCIYNSCNGTCYSDFQYCYNNTTICNNDELVCDVKYYSPFSSFTLGPTCYNSSELSCDDNTLCDPAYSCGTQCLRGFNAVCVNNETICYGFSYFSYYPYTNLYVSLCGPQQLCYDNTTSVCLNGTTVCQGLNSELCGTNCFNPDTQVCANGNIQCIYNSCNDTCYPNSQYCYNNTIICNNGELVCDVEYDSLFLWFPLGPTCYNPSELICDDNTLCEPAYSCGTQCLRNFTTVCVNNETICYGFDFFSYYPVTNRSISLCGPQQLCYDNTTSVCLNETTVCQGLNSELCETNCFNPDTQVCANGNIQCIYNSCNGTCYSDFQYCYNNTTICNNDELVCDVKYYSLFSSFPFGPTCYNPSELICDDNTLCDPAYSCGTQCLRNFTTVCVNNETICYGFAYFSYYPVTNIYVGLCGPQQLCYDTSTSICLGNPSIVCPNGNQLCSGVCCNPQTQYCISGNDTIYCLNNPSSSNCLLISTERPNSTLSTETTISSASNRNILLYESLFLLFCLFCFL